MYAFLPETCSFLLVYSRSSFLDWAAACVETLPVKVRQGGSFLLHPAPSQDLGPRMPLRKQRRKKAMQSSHAVSVSCAARQCTAARLLHSCPDVSSGVPRCHRGFAAGMNKKKTQRSRPFSRLTGMSYVYKLKEEENINKKERKHYDLIRRARKKKR